MYRAVIFDLDGTLVQTEKLKALSYAKAAHELSRGSVQEADVIDAFKRVVGRSRKEVSTYLLETFGLEDAASGHLLEFGVTRAWQAYARVRLRIYDEMLKDPDLLRNNQWPHNRDLLERARNRGCAMALATMSHREQTARVLDVLGLRRSFEFVATRDDVEHPKPHPEIYHLVAAELGEPERECLVIEDSPAGVRAARAAGTGVIAVTTPFTRQRFEDEDVLDQRWIVDDPTELPKILSECIVAHQRTHHSGSDDESEAPDVDDETVK